MILATWHRDGYETLYLVLHNDSPVAGPLPLPFPCLGGARRLILPASPRVLERSGRGNWGQGGLPLGHNGANYVLLQQASWSQATSENDIKPSLKLQGTACVWDECLYSPSCSPFVLFNKHARKLLFFPNGGFLADTYIMQSKALTSFFSVLFNN